MGRTLLAIFVAGLFSGSSAFVNVALPRHRFANGQSYASAATGATSATSMSVTNGEQKGSVSRAEAIRDVVTLGPGVLAAAGVVLATPRSQDVSWAAEMKDEVQQFSELRGELEKKGKEDQVKENLTLLTDATDGLKALDFFIGEKDYQSLRTAMRRPPIVYLRTSARKVIVNMDNEIEAKKTDAAYKALISSVDKLDSVANKGMREKGGLKDDKEITEVYDTCVERGSALLGLLTKTN